MPPAWRSKAPPFKILVHSPSKRASTLTGGYTIYSVTSLFRADDATGMHSRFSSTSTIAGSASARTLTPKDIQQHQQAASSSTASSHTLPYTLPDHELYTDPDDDDEPPTVHVTVFRRFSHFVFLHTALSRHLPGIALPPLPDKQYAGRFKRRFCGGKKGRPRKMAVSGGETPARAI